MCGAGMIQVVMLPMVQFQQYDLAHTFSDVRTVCICEVILLGLCQDIFVGLHVCAMMSFWDICSVIYTEDLQNP